MAKAIYGHIGADAVLAAELVRLRARVRELEAELQSLKQPTHSAVEWSAEEWILSDDDLLVPDPL